MKTNFISISFQFSIPASERINAKGFETHFWCVFLTVLCCLPFFPGLRLLRFSFFRSCLTENIKAISYFGILYDVKGWIFFWISYMVMLHRVIGEILMFSNHFFYSAVMSIFLLRKNLVVKLINYLISLNLTFMKIYWRCFCNIITYHFEIILNKIIFTRGCSKKSHKILVWCVSDHGI